MRQMTSEKPKSGYEIMLGASDNEPRVDGVKFWVASEAIEKRVRAAYEMPEADFERIVDSLCDARKAEYLGF